MNLDASQLSAVSNATTSTVSIITGGAGTGKTTIIKAITDQLEASGESVQLCAFAGKAAARLREATQHPASTVHRLLGYNGKIFQCETLKDQSIIIDESSMLDSYLLAEIVRREPKRLCLVGDQAQLPPVGRAAPFHDLINLRADIVSNLTTCYRATEAVFHAASTIREGGRPAMRSQSENEKWTMINTGSAERTQAKIIEWIKDGMFDFDKDVILCARNGDTIDDACTIKGLNAAIVDAISPRSDGIKWVVGDRVINTKNQPEMDVWNGTTGSIHSVDQDDNIWVNTDVPVIDWDKTTDERDATYTNYVLFDKDAKKHLQLAYALTVHKSQGSQHRRVLVVCLNRDAYSMLDRSLLYTAITRTKESCCVVGEMQSVYAAIDKVNHKHTVMQVMEGIKR